MATLKRRKAKKTYTPRDHYQEITDRVIAALEQGQIPWQRPVAGINVPAYNYVSGNSYRGINFLMLNFLSTRTQRAYLSFKQAKALGGKIRKGCKAEKVYFFKVLYRDADGNKISEIKAQELKDRGVKVLSNPFLRSTPVFNVDDVEGVDFDLPTVETFEHDPIEAAENFVDAIENGPAIETEKGDANYYLPSTDKVVMFARERYVSPEAYYHTLFHELTHSTGHADRLNREGITGEIKPGSAVYAREELTAEMGAAFLCAKTGVDPSIENTAAYVGNWLQALKNDKMLVYKAAAQAQQAVDLLSGERRK